ncbi:MAG: TMEM165/GDT1 family protein [Acidimicrobiaceae bacterium]|nr:TMEM165/GDT1 family protein [Acidimicrobiaceae bacterium]
MDWGIKISLRVIASVALAIFLAELPDKTSIAALFLARKLPRRQVLLGAWAALILQAIISVLVGTTLYLLLHNLARYLSVGVMSVTSVFMFIRVFRPEGTSEGAKKGPPRILNPFVISFMAIFLAEIGDVTEFATASFAASTHKPLAVVIGSSIGLVAASGISVNSSILMEKVPERILWAIGGGLMATFAIFTALGFTI